MKDDLTFRNDEYIFMPMSFPQPKDMYENFRSTLHESDHWTMPKKTYRYLLRYVTDRFSNVVDQEGINEKSQCYHVELNSRGRQAFGIPDEDSWVCAAGGKKSEEGMAFQIRNISLYCFNTGICIFSLGIRAGESDPYVISDLIYKLKKASACKVILKEGEESRTLLDVVKSICDPAFRAAADRTEGIAEEDRFRYFFYQNYGEERANALIYLERTGDGGADSPDRLEDSPACKRELYYLRNGFRRDFTYNERFDQDQFQTHCHSGWAVWSMSLEAAVCMTFPEKDPFIREKFYENLNTHYLFMYIMLIHQKYTLYMFLRNIADNEHEKRPEALVEYRDRLYEFETDFVFSCISEVPQYQILYEMMYKVLKLDSMYKDVREPLQMLSRLEQEKREQHEKKQEEEKSLQNWRMTEAMFLLSVLVVVSALTDGFDLSGSVLGSLGLPGLAIKTAQFLALAAIAVYFIYVMVKMRRNRKESRRSDGRK